MRDHGSSTTYRIGFDQLVIATGARPRRPDIPGVDAPGVHGVQTLDDGEALLDTLEHSPRRAVVVGGGYIGIEMAEAMVNRGLEVTVVTRSREPMATLDPDMGALVHQAMEDMGIDVRTSVQLREVDDRTGRAGHRRRHRPGGAAGRRRRAGHRRRAGDDAGRRRRAAARPVGRPGHRPADAGLRRRRRVGRRRLRRVDRPRLGQPGARRAGHPRQQAGPGRRHQPRRRLRDVPRRRRYGGEQGVRPRDRAHRAARARLRRGRASAT